MPTTIGRSRRADHRWDDLASDPAPQSRPQKTSEALRRKKSRTLPLIFPPHLARFALEVSCSKFRKCRIVSPIEYALSVSKKIPDVLMSRMIPHYERDSVTATIIFHRA